MDTKLLLLTPPFTQLNTPYPATAYLKGFLNTINITSFQADLGIEVILKLFSKEGLKGLFNEVKTAPDDENSSRIWYLQIEYIQTIDAVIAFLQGKNPTLALQICQDDFLPEASRFSALEDLDWAFGTMGLQDKAKHLATLYLEDISDFIIDCIDDNFGFSRYAERLGRSAATFDELYAALHQTPTYIDNITISVLANKIAHSQPDLVCFSVPFPGNLYSAFRCAQYIKQHFPNLKVAMGGGFPNTELRSLSDKRVFDFFDYITLDDGELPIAELVNNIKNEEHQKYKRTFLLENGAVVYKNNSEKKDYKQSQVGTPDYRNLVLDTYISVIELVNPMHRMWSDGRWNKLTLAHGCYWGKCTFCDVSLDYIKLYEPVAAQLICDRIEQLIEQTGQNGFHFVDEAAPPALMREVALEILRRKLVVTWWTNIRFEKSFTEDLCHLLKLSGCVAVSGGLEVASDRLLKLIDKGVTVAQVAKVTRNFTHSGILVHAYLMYGYPTQTIQETIDSLEMVRQLFELGILQSGFWHQFALTVHSPVGLEPASFGVKITNKNVGTFANNDVEFTDKTNIDHDKFSFGLKKSLFNYMHGVCFDFPLQDWFDFKIPKTTIPKNYISNLLEENEELKIKSSSKIIWIGGKPIIKYYTKSKKGKTWEILALKLHSKTEICEVEMPKNEGDWLVSTLDKIAVKNKKTVTFQELKDNFESDFENFELFWFSKPVLKLRTVGLLVL